MRLKGALGMGVGTLASRATGFVRTLLIFAALGTGGVADAYNASNTLPNILYDLLLGGVMASAVVPLLARHSEGEEGEGYAGRLLGSGLLILAGASVVGVVAAPLLVRAYTGSLEGDQGLAVLFARTFLPQIFFYGLSGLASAILSLRERFSVVGWAPVSNNIVVCVVAGLYLATGASQPSTGEAWLLGVGTTLGVVVQGGILLWALHRSGGVPPLGWRMRRGEVGEVLRLSGWVLGYVLTNQLLMLLVVRLTTSSVQGGRGGYTTYSGAWQLFQLPYALVGVSVITVLMPQISRLAHRGEHRRLGESLSRSMRVTGGILAPLALVSAVLGPDLGVILFSHGRVSVEDGRLVGLAFSLMAVGLVPFSLFQIQAKAFYALDAGRIPFWVNLGASAVNGVLDVVAWRVLPGGAKVGGMAGAVSVSYLLAAVVGGVMLRRWVRTPRMVRTQVRFTLAAVLPACVSLGVVLVVQAVSSSSGGAWVGVVAGGGAFLLLWAPVAWVCSPETFSMLRHLRRGS